VIQDSPHIVAIFGSPRRNGNTAKLLREAIAGARAAGVRVDEIVLRDLKLSPCMEIYSCKQGGECRIRDDFQKVRDLVLACGGLMLASPIFYYAVSAHTKILMDRFHSVWVQKHWVDKGFRPERSPRRKGLFISAGATQGRKLFEGTLLSVRYFYDTLDMDLWKALLYRGLEDADDVLKHPEYLEDARRAGKELAGALIGQAPATHRHSAPTPTLKHDLE
jgi:multimeric flavodoxin WrbA